MRTRSEFITVIIGCSLVSACLEPTSGDLPGSEEGDTSEGDDPSSQSPVESDGPCDLETHACISNVPEGWSGPVALTHDACVGAFDRDVIETFEDFLVDPTTCACTCGPAFNGYCSMTTQVGIYPSYSVGGVPYNASGCDTLEEEVSVALGGLTQFPAEWSSDDAFVVVDPPAVTSGACTPVPKRKIPTFELLGVAHACEPTDAIETCDDGGLCVPRPAEEFEDGICIWAMGEHECPAGTDFVNRELRSNGVKDTRGCTECRCDPSWDAYCEGAGASLHRETGDSVFVPADGECTQVDVGASTWTAVTFYNGVPANNECSPRGGEPQGDLTGENAVTFCCT